MSETEPREGLPPCILKTAMAGERQATLHKKSLCSTGDPLLHDAEYKVAAGTASGTLSDHPPFRWIEFDGPWAETDDPDEAEGIFIRAERWVRTGELE